jgi:uncharacterized DUF497 family protein
MFERILNELRDKIRARQYVMTTHAEEEMDDDGLSIFDVESVILSGSVIERQKDQNTGEWKYLVKGETLNHKSAVTVTKISPTGKLIFITVYRD